jgi:threonine dehydratase
MNSSSLVPLGLANVLTARARVAHGIRVTPCHISRAWSERLGAKIWLKRDDLQRTGSFKERGARHALLCLSAEERARGVVAASAGNHALGLAYHGAQLGVGVTVVMPGNAPEVKVRRCRSLGARVVLQGETFEAAQTFAHDHAVETGAALVHPFDDPRVIAGQGTLALEVCEQVPDFDAIVVPVGGGGLLAGIATVMKALRPTVRVIAVEPENAAGLRAAQRAGRPTPIALQRTLADGLSVACVGTNTFALAAPLIDDVVTVTEFELGRAVALFARDAGAVVEGAGAAPLAALLAGKVRARTVVLPVCGRNIDPQVHAGLLDAFPAENAPTRRAA